MIGPSHHFVEGKKSHLGYSNLNKNIVSKELDKNNLEKLYNNFLH